MKVLREDRDKAFGWEGPAEEILEKIMIADRSPGITQLLGRAVRVFDAHLGRAAPGVPASGPAGAVIARHGSAVLVGTGCGTVWIGQLSRPTTGDAPELKMPAATVLRGLLRTVPEAPSGPPPWLTYQRSGAVGELTFRPYNGALATRACKQLAVALRYALAQTTRILVVRGDSRLFCSGMHLGMIEAAADPAAEAWANLRALNAVCRRLCSLTSQLVITAYRGDAAAGGAMLGLGADVVVARQGIVLSPHYGLGLAGSQLHTYSLPLRVGVPVAQRLLTERLPIGTAEAAALGLVDAVGPGDPDEFDGWLTDRANSLATSRRAARSAATARRLALPRRPLAYYETAELGEMAKDIFDDRHEFARQRRAFLMKHSP